MSDRLNTISYEIIKGTIVGYMSDGDILQSPAQNDMNDGYMSEGGASFYAQRLQER